MSYFVLMQGVLLGADAVVPFRKQMKGVRPVEYAVGPPGDRCMMSLRGQIPSNFMKFTWHANLHYRYL